MIGFSIRRSSATNAVIRIDCQRAEPEHLGRAPAVVGRLDDRVDRAHQRGGHEQRPEPVDSLLEALTLVGTDQRLAEDEGQRADRQVDEEHPVPAQGLGEHAAGQQAQRATGDGHEHVGAHRAGALGGLGELGDDDRQDHRGLRGRAEALQEAGADQHALAGRHPAQQRGDGEDGETGEEDPLAPDEVAEPAGQQQQAAERDQERVDHPGQVALAEVELTLDRRQRDVHDRHVEHDHQLGQADDERASPSGADRAQRLQEEMRFIRLLWLKNQSDVG